MGLFGYGGNAYGAGGGNMDSGSNMGSVTPGTSDWNNLYGSGLVDTISGLPFNKDNPYTKSLPGVGGGGRYPANNIAISLAPAEYWRLADQLGFANSLQPQEHEAVQKYLNYLMHPQLMSDQFRQEQMGQITSQSPMLQNQLASAGAGQGAKEGAALSLFNNAARSANQFDANLFSPKGQADLAQGAVGLIGSQAPNWNDISTIAQITGGTPRNQSGLQTIGGLIGGIGATIPTGHGGNITI